jgi:hypothetical protein
MGYKEIVEILLLNDADPLVKENRGYNAITWGDILNQINPFCIVLIFVFLIKLQHIKKLKNYLKIMILN